MIFNTYEEEIDYILQYHGHSVLILSQDEDWILSEDDYWSTYLEDNSFTPLKQFKEKTKINWLKEGF
jgi:hypothetical protein